MTRIAVVPGFWDNGGCVVIDKLDEDFGVDPSTQMWWLSAGFPGSSGISVSQ